MPYIQFESVSDFISEPRCSKFVVGLQTSGSKIGGIRGPVGLQTEGPRVTEAPLCAKCSNVCCPNRSSCVRIVLIGRERIPFYRGRGRLYKRECERKRVCVLPSLVAHAVGYKTVCRRPQHCCRSDACGKLHRLLLAWQMSTPTIL